MAKGQNQKLKLLYIARFFNERTDEDHGVSVQDIITLLNQYEISADRKTIYQDIEELRRFGMDIIAEQQGRSVVYKLASRDFELAELKLLVDSVQSSKFITEKLSRKLINKLESLVSIYEGNQLNRQVILSGRVKTMNESIYYSVDTIHQAINQDRKIRFQYSQWNLKKVLVPRHDGAWYEVSPWALVWDDEYYYMIGYDACGIIKHYRVDKMQKLSVAATAREGREKYESMNLPSYSKSLFGMFGGNTIEVKLRCRNDMVGVIIDRFGKEIVIAPVDDDHFETIVKVTSSGQFLGWIIGLGDGVELVYPDSLIEELGAIAARLAKQYG